VEPTVLFHSPSENSAYFSVLLVISTSPLLKFLTLKDLQLAPKN